MFFNPFLKFKKPSHGLFKPKFEEETVIQRHNGVIQGMETTQSEKSKCFAPYYIDIIVSYRNSYFMLWLFMSKRYEP